jgi:hypothetical protein
MFTVSDLSEEFPEISRSALYIIVSKNLGYRKLCARWVPKMLSDDHKTQRMASALTFLTHYHNAGEILRPVKRMFSSFSVFTPPT